MKLAISNIAWTADEDGSAAEKLRSLDIKYIEIAPTKHWTDPLSAPDVEVSEYKKLWTANKLEVVAFQSMLYNRPDLKLFEGEEKLEEMVEYLKGFIKLSADFGAKVLVFGSPKNRQRGSMNNPEALKIAKRAFAELGKTAKESGVHFCIEPNPTEYQCDFVNTAREGIELVESVGQEGFGLHLDAAGMILAGDDIRSSIKDSRDILRHFHISAPFLNPPTGDNKKFYKEALSALDDINYDRFTSIEMKPRGESGNIDQATKAIDFVRTLSSFI